MGFLVPLVRHGGRKIVAILRSRWEQSVSGGSPVPFITPAIFRSRVSSLC